MDATRGTTILMQHETGGCGRRNAFLIHRFTMQSKIKKKAKPTHVSAGLNRLYVSVFDYGVTAIIN